jgi:hypothetical protein
MVLGGLGGANNSTSADGIRPLNGASGCGCYRDYPDTTVQAAIRYDGAYRVVFFACPFEAIDHTPSRYLQKWTLIARALTYLGERMPGITQPRPNPPSLSAGPFLEIRPNPFTRYTTVSFTAPVSGRMELRAFSTDGRMVASETQTAVIGQHMSFKLDGARLANGTYLVQVKTPAGIYAQKTAVLK